MGWAFENQVRTVLASALGTRYPLGMVHRLDTPHAIIPVGVWPTGGTLSLHGCHPLPEGDYAEGNVSRNHALRMRKEMRLLSICLRKNPRTGRLVALSAMFVRQ